MPALSPIQDGQRATTTSAFPGSQNDHKDYSNWSRLIKAVSNDSALPGLLRNGSVITLGTPHQCYRISSPNDGRICIEATRRSHSNFLKRWWFSITHCRALSPLLRHTPPDARAYELRRHITENRHKEICATTEPEVTQVRISYPGKNGNDASDFQKSADFKQFREKYEKEVMALSRFTGEENDFKKFLRRVFPATPACSYEGKRQIHQLYQLGDFFHEALSTISHSKNSLLQGSTPEDNQKRQDRFELQITILTQLPEAFNQCTDGLLTYISAIAERLSMASDLDDTFPQSLQKTVMRIIDDIIHKQMIRDRNQNVHTYRKYQDILDVERTGNDLYANRTIIKTKSIIEVRDALKAELKLSKLLAVPVTQYINEALLDETAIERRYELVEEKQRIAGQKACYKIDFTDSDSVFASLFLHHLYEIDEENYLILGLNKNIHIRLYVTLAEAIVKKFTSMQKPRSWFPFFRQQRNWIDFLNLQQKKVSESAEGTVWRIDDLFWRQLADGEIAQLSVQDLLRWFSEIAPNQRVDILEQAVQKKGTKSLSRMKWPGKKAIQQTDGSTLWCVSDFFWLESPDGTVSPLGMQDLLKFADKISVRQRLAILQPTTREDAPLLSQLDPKYLLQDGKNIAEFLKKMGDGRTGIDYAIKHAGWFKKYLHGFSVNPLAEIILNLNTKELAMLPSFIFDGMSSAQRERLFQLMAPPWLPGDISQTDLLRLIALPETLQNYNDIADRIQNYLQAVDNQTLQAISLENMLNISQEILQREEMSDVLARYFRTYTETDATIDNTLLLKFPEYQAEILRILLREIPPHKIFTGRAGEKLWDTLSQKKLAPEIALQAYLDTYPGYLFWLTRDEIAALPQNLKNTISLAISHYSADNIITVKAYLESVLESVFSASGEQKRERSEFMRALLKIIPFDLQQTVFLGVAPDKLFHDYTGPDWRSDIFNAHGRKKTLESYLEAYLNAHPDYLYTLKLSGIAMLPRNVTKLIHTQISNYVNSNIPAARASLLDTLEKESAALYPGKTLQLADNSPTLRNLKLLSPTTLWEVLQEIPPQKLFLLSEVRTEDFHWGRYFSLILRETCQEPTDPIKKYVDLYLATHPDYWHTLQDIYIPPYFIDAISAARRRALQTKSAH